MAAEADLLEEEEEEEEEEAVEEDEQEDGDEGVSPGCSCHYGGGCLMFSCYRPVRTEKQWKMEMRQKMLGSLMDRLLVSRRHQR